MAGVSWLPLESNPEVMNKSESEPLGKVDGSNQDVYFIKQTISNACGTMGILHALGNNRKTLGIADSCFIAEFFDQTKALDPNARAAYMEKSEKLSATHEESAQRGQTRAPDRDEKTNYHFVCFIHQDGGLYELDGRKDGPVRHGNTAPDRLLEDACEVVRKFMSRDPENVNFNMVALAKV